MTEQLEVLWPLGRSTAQHISMSPRLASSGPKRFGFMWSYTFRGEEVFPLIQAGLAERFPGSTFVPYGEFGAIHGLNQAVNVSHPRRVRASAGPRRVGLASPSRPAAPLPGWRSPPS